MPVLRLAQYGGEPPGGSLSLLRTADGLAIDDQCCCPACVDCADLLAHIQGINLRVSGFVDYDITVNCECCTAYSAPPEGCLSTEVIGESVKHHLCSAVNGTYSLLDFEVIDGISVCGELQLAEGDCDDPGIEIANVTCELPKPPCAALDFLGNPVPDSRTVKNYLTRVGACISCSVEDGVAVIRSASIQFDEGAHGYSPDCETGSEVYDNTCCFRWAFLEDFHITLDEFCLGHALVKTAKQRDCLDNDVGDLTFELLPIIPIP